MTKGLEKDHCSNPSESGLWLDHGNMEGLKCSNGLDIWGGIWETEVEGDHKNFGLRIKKKVSVLFISAMNISRGSKFGGENQEMYNEKLDTVFGGLCILSLEIISCSDTEKSN